MGAYNKVSKVAKVSKVTKVEKSNCKKLILIF